MDFYSLERIEDAAIAGSKLKSVYFHCKAPQYCSEDAFMPRVDDDFCIYFDKGMEGFTRYSWNGYVSYCIDPETGEILPPLFGDASGDDAVNTTDAVYILKSTVNLITFTNEQREVADANKDGNITTSDAVQILKYSAGLIPEL